MTVPRSSVLEEEEESIYHCRSRCVRRAYLCGYDRLTGKSFDHRKEWVRKRLEFLVSVFAIEVLAYALMSNHMHSLLRTFPELALSWSEEEVARRWLTLFPKCWNQNHEPVEPSEEEIEEITASKERVVELRKRLGSVSWFMKALNEHIARGANKEDGCTGSFWEGRFKCSRIEDEAGLLACAAYIDLNPVRAKLAKTPEESDFTSVQERIISLKQRKEGKNEPQLWITPVERTEAQPRGFLSISLEEYLKLVDTTGRVLVEGKAGAIPEGLPPILCRLGIKPERWMDAVRETGSRGHRKIKINSLKLLEKGLIDPVRGCAGWMRRDLLQRIVE